MTGTDVCGTSIFASFSQASAFMEVQTNRPPTFDNGAAFCLMNNCDLRTSDMNRALEKVSELQNLSGQMTENTSELCATAVPSRAAMKVQKVYRSYRTRRMLADSVVVAEELWWQAIEYARLNHSTISFFNIQKPETPAVRLSRVSLNASKVGKGLSEDEKAQILAFQHWIEAIDPRHRYGHNLHMYFDEWCKSSSGQPFFFWLDVGDGKEVDLKSCPRSKLRQQCIKYLGPLEREHFEFMVVDGIILHNLTGKPLDTRGGSPGSKWIFVMSTSKRLYVGEKTKGLFHHSSFLAGGATLAAGRLVAEIGILKCISPYSGHYKPTDDSLDCFLSFLEKYGVSLEDVKILQANEDCEGRKLAEDGPETQVSEVSDLFPSDCPAEEEISSSETTEGSHLQIKSEYKRTLSGGLQSCKTVVPESAILQRINSKKAAQSYQLGHQLSRKWSTGAGPRIGCIADYPVELRLPAFELAKLSPRTGGSLPTFKRTDSLVSPSACPTIDDEATSSSFSP